MAYVARPRPLQDGYDTQTHDKFLKYT